jgi:hypothetical protein
VEKGKDWARFGKGLGSHCSRPTGERDARQCRA